MCKSAESRDACKYLAALKTHHTYCFMNIIFIEAADIRDSLIMPYVPRVSFCRSPHYGYLVSLVLDNKQHPEDLHKMSPMWAIK